MFTSVEAREQHATYIPLKGVSCSASVAGPDSGITQNSKGIIIDGKGLKLTCEGMPVELVDGTIKNNLLATKRFGVVEIKPTRTFSSSVDIFVTAKQNAELREAFGNLKDSEVAIKKGETRDDCLNRNGIIMQNINGDWHLKLGNHKSSVTYRQGMTIKGLMDAASKAGVKLTKVSDGIYDLDGMYEIAANINAQTDVIEMILISIEGKKVDQLCGARGSSSP
jgi:hypothetical protein